jgi:hypothetical protein
LEKIMNGQQNGQQNGHQSAQPNVAQQRGMKAVFTVVERGAGKSYWTRIGVGFVNNDGSLNLRLDALPINGTLQVREWEQPRELDRRPSTDAPPRERPARDLSADSLL